MVLDQAANFVRGTVDSAISAGDTTISVTDASAFPDPSGSNYNLILWDAGSHNIPDNDPNVEIVRVTGRDTSTDDLTVTRGEESTSDSDHPATSVLQMAWTAKMRDDAESEFTTLQNNIDAINSYDAAAIDDTDSPYTTTGEEVITADTSSGAVTVTLATADVSKDGPTTVVNISGSNAVTVNTEGSETIDPGGDSSKSWSTEGWAVKFTPDGSNWDSNLDADVETVTTDTLTVGGFTGTPLWVEESGSPYTATGASSANSINPSGLDSFDVYLIAFKATDQASSSNNIDMQVDGDTGSNYDERLTDGTLNNGQTEWGRLKTASPGETATGRLLLADSAGSGTVLNNQNPNPQNAVSTGSNANVTFPPSQFTLLRGADTDWTVRVWGRNL